MKHFTQYRRKQISELRPYIQGEDLAGVSIAEVDIQAGSPKEGDMIARNPKNLLDQWLVAKQYFLDNFEPIDKWQSIETAPTDGRDIWISDGDEVWYIIAHRDGTHKEPEARKCKFWMNMYWPEPPNAHP